VKGKSDLPTFYAAPLIVPRYTQPLPESVFQKVEEELFDGDLTDEDEQTQYVPPYTVSVTHSCSRQSRKKKFKRRGSRRMNSTAGSRLVKKLVEKMALNEG
jgi:hypothetical protein